MFDVPVVNMKLDNYNNNNNINNNYNPRIAGNH